jgi:protein involved in ribonucleotide reduction
MSDFMKSNRQFIVAVFLLFFLPFYVFENVLQASDAEKQASSPLQAQQTPPAEPLTQTNEVKTTQTALSFTPNEALVYSQPITFVAKVVPTLLPGDIPTGTVRFRITNRANQEILSVTQSLFNGIATFTTNSIPAVRFQEQYYVSAVYSGNEMYEGSGDTLWLSVSQANTSIDLISSYNPSTVGQPLSFTAFVSANPPATDVPNGMIEFRLDGKIVANTNVDANGKAIFSIPDLPAGTHTLIATYGGNENFNGSWSKQIQRVNKAMTYTTISSSPNPIHFGQKVMSRVTVTSETITPTGTVQFKVDGKNWGSSQELDEKGQTAIVFEDLAAGIHTLEANYLGNANFNPSIDSLNQEVNKAETAAALDATPNPSTYGEQVNFTAAITAQNLQVPGSVQFKLNGKNLGGPQPLDGNGQAAIIVPDLGAGKYKVEIYYAGDANFNPSKAALTQEVHKADTAAALDATPNPSTYGEQVNFTAAITAQNLQVPGSVQFKLNGKNLENPQLLDGNGQAAIIVPDLGAGKYKVEIYYAGDANFNPSKAALTQEVHKADTAAALDATPNPSTYGEQVNFTAAITAQNLQVPGSVQFKLNEKDFGDPQLLDNRGKAAIVAQDLVAGQHKIGVFYAGNANFNPSKAALTQEVHKADTVAALDAAPNPSTYGDQVTVNARVTSEYAVVSGSIQFKLDGQNVDSAQMLDSQSQASLTIPGLAAGSHVVDFYYLGTDNFNSSQATLTQQVNKADTTTSLAASAISSTLGEPLTLSAVVASSVEKPMGSVQFFMEGKKMSDPVTLNDSGQAFLEVQNLEIGTYRMQAVYLGSDNFNGSSSQEVVVVVHASLEDKERQGKQDQEMIIEDKNQTPRVRQKAEEKKSWIEFKEKAVHKI